MQIYTNGLGANSGDTLVTCEALQVSGNVWWCNSTTGVDAGSPQGLDREAPLLTIAQAMANAALGDIIVLQNGFTETCVAPLACRAGITLVGEGSSGGQPTRSLINNQAAGEILSVSAVGVEIRNIKFPANLQVNASAKIIVTNHNSRIIGCYFEGGPHDHAAQVQYGVAADWTCQVVRNTTFISVAPTCADRPYTGIYIPRGNNYMTLDGVTFDDGPFGWNVDYAFYGMAAASLYFRMIGVSLLHGASMYMNGTVAGTSLGWLNVQTRTGGGRVNWP